MNVAIARDGKPVVRILPIGQPGLREVGFDRGLFAIPDDVDDPPVVRALARALIAEVGSSGLDEAPAAVLG